MSRNFNLTATPGGVLRTACKACGAQYEAVNYSWIVAWRAAHDTECATPEGAA